MEGKHALTFHREKQNELGKGFWLHSRSVEKPVIAFLCNMKFMMTKQVHLKVLSCNKAV